MHLGRHAEAEEELLTCLEGVRAILGNDHWRTRRIYEYLAQLYGTTGDTDRAAHYQTLAEQESAPLSSP